MSPYKIFTCHETFHLKSADFVHAKPSKEPNTPERDFGFDILRYSNS